MIVAYDPDVHQRFVFSAWCNGAGEPWGKLHRIMREGARCAVRVGNNNQPVLIDGQWRIVIMGYVVVAGPQAVVWAYTKTRLQGQGIFKSLLEHFGVDRTKPMVALFPSVCSDALIGKGWPIEYPAPELRAALNDQRAALDGR